jgi:hypothetical protein
MTPALENAAVHGTQTHERVVARRPIAFICYFELDYRPRIKKKSLTCKSQILCFFHYKKGPSRPVEKLAADSVRFHVNRPVLPERMTKLLSKDSSYFYRHI